MIAEIPQRQTPSLLGQLEQLGATFSAGRGTQHLNEIQLVGDDMGVLRSWIHDGDVVDVDDSLERFSQSEIRRIMLVRQQNGVIHLTCPQNPRHDFEPKTPWDLGDDLVGDLAAAGDFDLVLGLPSYNVATTLRNNIECLAQGAHELGAELRCLVVVSDSGSKDKSLEDCWTH